MSKFYIGAKVIAIRDHSQGAFKKGDKFEIIGLKKGCCNFNNTIVDIGILADKGFLRCHKCNLVEATKKWWFGANSFRLIEDAPELSNSTIEELLEELEVIPINKIDKVYEMIENFIKQHSTPIKAP